MSTDVADRVRVWRVREGLSLERAGRLLGVAHTTVRDWEAGRHPGDLNLARLHEVIGEQRDEPEPPLRQARIRQGLTLQQLARRLSVAVSTVSMWERGLRQPSCEHRGRVAQALGLDPGQAHQLLPPCQRRVTCCPPGRSTNSSRLGRLRRARGMARADAARRLDVSESRLARLEVGTSTPDLVLCAAMARVYRVPFAVVAQAGGVSPDPLLDRRRWDDAELHEVLVVLRRACGVSAAAVARDVTVTARTMRRWEVGLVVPTDVALRRLELRYRLDPGELQRLGTRARKRVSTRPPESRGHLIAHEPEVSGVASAACAARLANSAIS